jgi:mRNA-degrading endonuclease RelE of RelBE toxin-antitoxin system
MEFPVAKCDQLFYLLVIMAIYFKSAFRNYLKKQSRPFRLAIKDEVERVIDDPALGELKKGDLANIRVHKFRFKNQEYLIGYCLESEDLLFYMIGTHENFYRDLKRFIREVESS